MLRGTGIFTHPLAEKKYDFNEGKDTSPMEQYEISRSHIWVKHPKKNLRTHSFTVNPFPKKFLDPKLKFYWLQQPKKGFFVVKVNIPFKFSRNILA